MKPAASHMKNAAKNKENQPATNFHCVNGKNTFGVLAVACAGALIGAAITSAILFAVFR